ncbi:hypothetical protein AB9E28_35410, partial [Rhizobium leguminosarum]|uniref:hypothetical protein n=1 Tax=Rhizobium leguminosarum TaxID=384 RepID=UPI003F9BA469
ASPRSMMNSVGSTKALKPTRRRLLNFMQKLRGAGRACHAATKKRAHGFRRRTFYRHDPVQSRLSLSFDKVSTGMPPE